jgi:hypothetical protein
VRCGARNHSQQVAIVLVRVVSEQAGRLGHRVRGRRGGCSSGCGRLARPRCGGRLLCSARLCRGALSLATPLCGHSCPHRSFKVKIAILLLLVIIVLPAVAATPAAAGAALAALVAVAAGAAPLAAGKLRSGLSRLCSLSAFPFPIVVVVLAGHGSEHARLLSALRLPPRFIRHQALLLVLLVLRSLVRLVQARRVARKRRRAARTATGPAAAPQGAHVARRDRALQALDGPLVHLRLQLRVQRRLRARHLVRGLLLVQVVYDVSLELGSDVCTHARCRALLVQLNHALQRG